MWNAFVQLGVAAAFHRRYLWSAPVAASRLGDRIGSHRMSAGSIVQAFNIRCSGRLSGSTVIGCAMRSCDLVARRRSIADINVRHPVRPARNMWPHRNFVFGNVFM